MELLEANKALFAVVLQNLFVREIFSIPNMVCDNTTNIHSDQGPISCIGPRGWYGTS
jgi:hypothetical protein